jgi:hypothetical protein
MTSTACATTNSTVQHFAHTVGDLLPCGHPAARQSDGSLACDAADEPLTCTRCGIAVKHVAPRGSAARYVHVRTPDAPHIAELAEQPATFVADDRITRPGDSEPSCRSCGYFTGHTSWCPRRHGAQPEQQLTLEPADDPTAPLPGESVGTWAARVIEREVADRDTAVAELDDAALWLQFMIEDRALAGYDDDSNEPDDERHGALIAEITRRFGADATDNTADHAVSLHMSSDDLITWARDNSEHLIGVATGRIVPGWRREDGFAVDGRTHGTGCGQCDAAVESAVGAARVLGALGATYEDGEHVATVSRQPVGAR